MANRFLETNYFKSPFVRGLKGSLKGLYSFIICDCTPSGIWAMDMEAASMYIGFQVTQEEFEENFVKKNKAVSLGKGRYFFPDFIEHQYPKGLSDKNTAHIKVIPELKKYGLIDDKYNLIKVKKNDPLKPLESPIGIGKGLGNGKNVFNTKPIPENFNGLPDQTKQAAYEIVFRTQQVKVNDENLIGMWNVFKIQNLTGENYYPNEGKVYSHFINWIKTQKFDNGLSKGNRKLNTGEARQEANRDY